MKAKLKLGWLISWTYKVSLSPHINLKRVDFVQI